MRRQHEECNGNDMQHATTACNMHPTSNGQHATLIVQHAAGNMKNATATTCNMQRKHTTCIQHAARNMQHALCNTHQETAGFVEHETRNMHTLRGRCNMQHATCNNNVHHDSCGMQHAQCDMRRAPCNAQQCSMQHATALGNCDHQHAACRGGGGYDLRAAAPAAGERLWLSAPLQTPAIRRYGAAPN